MKSSAKPKQSSKEEHLFSWRHQQWVWWKSHFSPSSCKAQGDSGSLEISKRLHLVPFWPKWDPITTEKRKSLPSGSPTCEPALSVSRVLEMRVFWCTEVWLQGVPNAGLSIRLAFEIHLCHLLLHVKDLFISLRLFLVEWAVASKWMALTDAVIETSVGRKQIFQICA